MTLGSVETGGVVACTSFFTMIISRIKCYYKNQSCLCACMDSKEHELLYKNSDKSSDKSKSDKSDSDYFYKKKN